MRWGRERRDDSGGAGVASCQHPQKEKHGGLKAGSSGLLSQRSPPIPVDAALGTVLARGCSHHLSVAFALLPINIYLFIDFYEVSLPSNPYCLCCPDHPPSHSGVCAAVCLSVTRKIKTASSRTYVCGLWGGMARGTGGARCWGYWDRGIPAFSGPVRAKV